MAEHADAVPALHRFQDIAFNGTPWDLSHLEPFAMTRTIDLSANQSIDVTIVVFFSNHCFSKSYARDGRAEADVPSGEKYDDGREKRVLCVERYAYSQQFLPALIQELPERTIQIANSSPQNFFTFEELDDLGALVRRYSIFFTVERDRTRKKRMLLRVQSAYAHTEITARARKAGKVKLQTLLKAVYEGRKIKG